MMIMMFGSMNFVAFQCVHPGNVLATSLGYDGCSLASMVLLVLGIAVISGSFNFVAFTS